MDSYRPILTPEAVSFSSTIKRLRCHRFHESLPDSKLLLTSRKGWVYHYVYETLCWESSFGTSENDIQRLFSQAGSVESVSMITDRDTGRSRGFAFVEMSSKSEGESAIARFNSSELDGRSLVERSKPRENHGGGFDGGRNGGGRGGNFGRGRGNGRSRY